MIADDSELRRNSYDAKSSTGEDEMETAESERLRQLELERLQKEANEVTTKSEDLANLRQLLQEMSANQIRPNQQDGNASNRFYIGQDPAETAYRPLETADNNQFYSELHTEAPDGGWGWLVVLGSFVFMSLVDGICFTYGLLVPELCRYFELENSVPLAMIPGSLITGMYILTGPLANLLANSFDYRGVALMGAIFATIAIFGSSFVRNYPAFTALFGVLGGIGFGLIYLPAIAIVGIWFQRRRALAVGLALCGSGMGTLLFGQTTPLALMDVTFAELMIIWAAVSAQCVVAVVLFRPLDVHERILAEDNRRKREKEEKQKMMLMQKKEKEKNKMTQKPKRYRVTIQRGSIMQRIIEEKKRQRTTSVGSLDGMVITRDNELIESSPDQYINPIISQNAINRIAENLFRRRLGRQKSQELSRDSLMTKENMTQLVQVYVSQISLQGGLGNNYQLIGGSKSGTENNSTIALNTQPGSGEVSQSSLNSHSQPVSQTNVNLDENIEGEIQREIIKELSRPVYRKDVYYSGSFSQLGAHGMPTFNRSLLSLQNAAGGTSNIPSGQPAPVEDNNNLMRAFLMDMFDVKLLRSPTFILLIFASVLSMLGFFVPFHYFPLYLSEPSGLTKAGHIISVMGVFNTIGRLLATAYIEHNISGRYEYLDCLWIHNGALLLAAVSALLMTLFQGYFAAYIVLGAVYSLSMAAFISLKSILVVELFGIQRLTNAFSFLLLFQGISVIASTPLATLLNKVFNTTLAPFHFAAICVGVSAFAHMPLRIVADWECHRMEQRMQSNSNDFEMVGGTNVLLPQPHHHTLLTEDAQQRLAQAVPLLQSGGLEGEAEVNDIITTIPQMQLASEVIKEESEDEIRQYQSPLLSVKEDD